MKLNFPIPVDESMHRFCIRCNTDHVEQLRQPDGNKYHCPACGHTDERAIYFNEHKAWLDDDQNLWHESSVVFVKNSSGKFLFYTRTEFPFVLAIPAGHVDKGETGLAAAKRELEEETGLKIDQLKHIASVDMPGDSCSAGADTHHSHVFVAQYHEGTAITLGDEGKKLEWLTLDQAQKRGTVFAVTFGITHFRDQLE